MNLIKSVHRGTECPRRCLKIAATQAKQENKRAIWSGSFFLVKITNKLPVPRQVLLR
jgi:hypothetical protein